MNGPAEFTMLAPPAIGAVAQALLPPYSVRAALLLDHGDSPQRVRECLAAGYTSVMLGLLHPPYRGETSTPCAKWSRWPVRSE